MYGDMIGIFVHHLLLLWLIRFKCIIYGVYTSLLRHPAFPKVNEETFRPFTNLVLGEPASLVLLVTIIEVCAILLVVLCVQAVSWWYCWSMMISISRELQRKGELREQS